MTPIASRLRQHGAVLLLLAAAGATYSRTQQSFGMLMWDEAEYASIARSVLRGEGFAIAGKPNLLRPPLLPLAGAASMWATGAVDDRSVKLATLALAILALGVAYATTSTAFDGVTGLFAAYLLATAPQFWVMTGQFLSEIPFLAFFSAAILGFELGLRGNPRWFWLSWVSWVLALMTRYTATLFGLFVLLRLAGALLLRREEQWSRVRTVEFLGAPLVAMLLVVPWLLRQQIAFGDALIGFKQASQQLQMYMPAVSMPWYFYLVHLPDMLSPPTTVLLAFGVIWTVWRRNGVTLACSLVIIGILLWFSVYRYKEIRLVTSILPFAAIVASVGVTQILRDRWRLALLPTALIIFMWNQRLTAPIFSTQITLGYPPFLEALQFVREHSPREAVIMGASRPQIAWYADRRVIEFPEPAELATALQKSEWVVLTSFERGQKSYATSIARQLSAMNAPGEIIPFSDQRFSVIVVRGEFIRQHLQRSSSG
ncbi:MAG: glycosyltransferase family 39 protein [Deltaproteobacteria bacterium]|nr:glycosyltransferase family 39 protein [Deltaproteobacteria bacterium]